MNASVASGFDDSRFDDERVATSGPEFVTARPGVNVDGVMQSIRNFATLSEVLRVLGAAVILASMSVFMLQGWNDGNDIRRYLLLLTQTGLLATAGFAMSHGLKEAKGARIFFGLALVSIPANFTILGALLYSVLQWDGALINYPGYASWQIENVASTGMTLGGAMFVLIPVTLFCFAIMARHSAKSLSVHFLFLNALLLLPIRSSLTAGTIALLGVLYALYVVSKLTAKDQALKTGEGKFALTTLFIPIGIILFRSLYFYQVDSLMIAMLSMTFFLAARQASLFPDRHARMALLLEVISLPLALSVAMSLTDTLSPITAAALQAPLVAGLYSILALDILRRTDSKKLTGLIGVSISLFVALSFSFSVAASPSVATAFLSLIAGAMLLLWGLALKRPITSASGLVTLAAGVLFGFTEIVQFIMTSGWIELAIFGASTIALGSVLDRHGVAIKLHVVKWFNAIGEQPGQIALED